MLVATIASVHVFSDAELVGLGRPPRDGANERMLGASCPVMMATHVAQPGQAAVGFPLQAMDVEVTAVGITASIELMQQFVNRSPYPMEATYIFPMPDRMAVRRFRMECNGRVIEGSIDERGAARQQYDHAIAQGQRAAIAEEERPGVFTMRVGNVMPGEAPIVRLTLIGPLSVDDGEVTLQFPLLVAPRYTSGAALGGEQAGDGVAADTDAVPDASRVAPPVRIAGYGQQVRLSGRVTIDGGTSVVSAVSTSLPMAVSPTDGTLRLDLASGQLLNRDLIVRWKLANETLTTTLTCVDDADGAAGTFSLLVVPPTAATMAQRSRDVVFILDRSGSMQGWQMVAARRAVARMIDSLNSKDRFAVMAFDDRIEQPSFDGGRALVTATDRNRFVAVEFLAKVDARGGTEMEQPLAVAAATLQQSPMDRERVIVLATDGQVTGEDQILGRLTPMLQGTRVFTIGIDQGVNAAFLRRLANAGAGLFELVESEDRLDQVMSKIHGRIGMPVLSNLGLDGEGLAIDARTLAPARCTDVYAGAPVLITGRYVGKASPSARVRLRGVQFGAEFAQTVAQQPERQTFLERYALSSVWARARLRDLEDRYAAGGQSHPVRDELEQEMVRISTTFSVLCRFTAFVAVDRSEVANRTGYQQRVIQAVEEKAKADAGMLRGRAQTTPQFNHAVPAPMSAPLPAPGSAPMAASASHSVASAPPSSSMAKRSVSYEAEEEFDVSDVAASPLMSPAFDMKESAPVPSAPMRKSTRPAPAKVAPPSAPPRLSSIPVVHSMAEPALDRGPSKGGQASPAQLARLRELATALSVALPRKQIMALRVEVTRLREWTEDASSTMVASQLVRTIEAIVVELERLLRAASLDEAAFGALIASIGDAANAAGGNAGPGPAPTAPSRKPFWKRNR